MQLLADVEAMETRLIEFATGAPASALRGTTWEDVGEQVYVQMHRRHVEDHAKILRGIRIRDVPDRIGNLTILRAAVDAQDRANRSIGESEARTLCLLAEATALVLHQRG